MKNLITAIIIAVSFNSFAMQDATINAFSSSYNFESYKQYDKAIAALQSVYYVKSYEINLRLGWLHYLSGEHTESVKFYAQAISLQPQSIEALYGLTYPQAAMLNWNDLFNTYSEILKIDPKNKTANYRSAEIKFNQKNYEAASTYLTILIETYPFDYDANVLMAQIKTKQGEISEAKKLYNKALMYNPDNVDILKALIQLQ